MELISVAAMADNRVIGKGTTVPWNLPEDIEQYRRRVADAPVIVGRRTFEWVQSDPPGNIQIVMSQTKREYSTETAHHASQVNEAVGIVDSLGFNTAYVLGGESIYTLFQPHIDRMVLSRVPGEYDGDAYYPEWNPNEWKLVDEVIYDDFTVEDWVRAP